MNIAERYIKNIVVGSGAAGLNAAARLNMLGEKDTAVVTENILAGTSRNTGSDKQTYYKLSLAGGDRDSVADMAADLFAGGCVDGDQALCEAALSVKSFFRLLELGVPFPCNSYGEYVGYKTDHDRGRRATSVGPYTSKAMTECLEADVRRRNIEILNGFQAVKLLTEGGKICGALFLDKNGAKEGNVSPYLLIHCENCILATGGPAGMYRDSVYPESQTGSSGMAFEAGAKGKNLTEWQYGMASLRPRWNVSGTYMQSLPRFISTDAEGHGGREFLLDSFKDPYEMLSDTFLKGYQWPFDTAKISGSSLIDLLVYTERCVKGRRVFLDFTKNPAFYEIDFEKLSPECRDYLSHAGACFGTPYERLVKMNSPAAQFYLEHGVDLEKQPLEIAICAQHNNGGLAADEYWRTSVEGLYAVGELCGSHGVTRPGGTALNAGQVGAERAAWHFAHKDESGDGKDGTNDADIKNIAEKFVCMPSSCTGDTEISELWNRAQERMSRAAAMIRNPEELQAAFEDAVYETENFEKIVKAPENGQLTAFYHLRDMLISQVVYIGAMLDYIGEGGGSRGSALYTDSEGQKSADFLPEMFRCRQDNGKNSGRVQEVLYAPETKEKIKCYWRPVRQIPQPDNFFETEWKAFREREKK